MITKKEHKGFEIIPDPSGRLYTIKRIGKGQLPSALKGSFTNSVLAKKLIDASLKGKDNGKNSSDKEG